MTNSRSATIDGLLATHGVPVGQRASEHPCEGSKFHSPTPLVTFPYPTQVNEDKIYLCPTCATNLDAYIHLAQQAGDQFTWTVRREFGNQIRALGQKLIESPERGNHA